MTPEQIEDAKKVVKLSILIPVTPDRFWMLNNLYNELRRQIEQGGYTGRGIEKWDVERPRMKDGQPVLSEHGSPIIDVFSHSFKHPDIVEIVLDKSNLSIGTKRNNLLQKALGKYVCFIDSDDWISKDYVKLIMQGIEKEPDCISIKGVYTEDGQNPCLFEHSLKYNKWETSNGPIKYLRNPNHLNTIRADIAKQFKFPETNFGEDHDFSKQLQRSGLLKTEHYIDEVLYEYRFISKKAIA